MGYLEDKRNALLMNVVSGGGRLPSEYQEVEWIGNDSTAYLVIDTYVQATDYIESEFAHEDGNADKIHNIIKDSQQ